MKRREFLKCLILLGLSACTRNLNMGSSIAESPIRNWDPLPPRIYPPNGNSKSFVGTSHVSRISDEAIGKLVRDAIEAAGEFDKVVRPGDHVLIKPNLVHDLPNGTGATTDVRVAEAVAKLALDCGARKITFAEGSSCPNDKRYLLHNGPMDREVTERAFARSGFADLAKKLNASLVDLNDAGKSYGNMDLVTEVELKHGLLNPSYYISKYFLDADRVISVPVLKNHEYAGVTLSLKNYIGVAPADIYHKAGAGCGKAGLNHSVVGLAKQIVDLVMTRPPDYTVIDALVGVSNGVTYRVYRPGPKGKMKAILAGKDPVAVDTICCMAMGYDPATIGHIVLSCFRRNWSFPQYVLAITQRGGKRHE